MTKRMDTHERLTRDERGSGGSNRGFGVVFAVVFTVIGLFPLLDGAPPRAWSLAVAGIVLTAALVKADLLAPLNRIWFRFGLLLHGIVSPIILAVIYYAVVTPTGLVLRAMGKDPLRLRRDPNAGSYWIHRDPPGPVPKSMENQF